MIGLILINTYNPTTAILTPTYYSFPACGGLTHPTALATVSLHADEDGTEGDMKRTRGVDKP